MWFAALGGNCRWQPWFLRFEQRLLEGSPEVLALLRDNPFPDRPPRLIRARLEDLSIHAWGSREWWDRNELGLFCSSISLDRLNPARADPLGDKIRIPEDSVDVLARGPDGSSKQRLSTT